MDVDEYRKYRDEIDDNRFGGTGFILAIVGFFGIASIICGILAIVFGAVQIKKESNPIAKASIALGIADIVLRLITFAVIALILIKKFS
ncbi:MAG: hypothetical protein J6Z34_00500 [Clostridia bacterium]|nr:hypothetical protein [Clostridia bacterium]